MISQARNLLSSFNRTDTEDRALELLHEGAEKEQLAQLVVQLEDELARTLGLDISERAPQADRTELLLEFDMEPRELALQVIHLAEAIVDAEQAMETPAPEQSQSREPVSPLRLAEQKLSQAANLIREAAELQKDIIRPSELDELDRMAGRLDGITGRPYQGNLGFSSQSSANVSASRFDGSRIQSAC